MVGVFRKAFDETGFFVSDMHEKLLGFREKTLGFGRKISQSMEKFFEFHWKLSEFRSTKPENRQKKV